MNNSRIAIEDVSLELEEPFDTQPILREQSTELLEIIEALDNITKSAYWKILQEKVWSGILTSLQRRINIEKDTQEIARLQGQIVWAEKYTDLNKLTQVYRTKLQNIKKQIQ
jgi:methionine salvage enolase-phosphatase E1